MSARDDEDLEKQQATTSTLPVPTARLRTYPVSQNPASISSTSTELQTPSTGLHKPPSPPPTAQATQDLIHTLSTPLISHGCPSHRIGPILESLGHALHQPVTVYALHTYTLLSFAAPGGGGGGGGRRSGGPPTLYDINKRGSMNFTKLPLVFALLKRVIRDPAGVVVGEVYEELQRIEETKDAWGAWAVAASYIPAAATSAIMFFGGGWKEAGLSGALAVVPAGLGLVAGRWGGLWYIYEPLSCFLISLLASVLSTRFSFCYSTLILSAPVSLLPGYTVSIAVVEIMTKNTIAGCIRLCYTVVYLCCMVLGLTLAPILLNAPGDRSGAGFGRQPVGGICDTARGIVVNSWWLVACVPVYIAAYNVYLKTPLRQWPIMIAVGSLGYGAGFATKHIWHAPPELNAFAASLTLGFFANLYAKLTDDFAFNCIVAGVFIQVPGSWGIRGLLAFAYGDYEKGIYWNYSMLVICVAISVALILSNYIFFGFKLQNRGAPHMDF